MRLNNKQYVITGALGGIGSATVRRFAEEGASLWITDRHEDGADAVVDQLRQFNQNIFFTKADLSCESEVRSLFERIDQQWSHLDGLINIAGYDHENGVAADKVSAAGLDACIKANLQTTILCCEQAIPRLKRSGGGYIVNIGSVTYRGSARQIAYSSTKGGVYSYTRSLAMALGADTIKVNSIAPGFTEVDTIKKAIPVYVWPLLKWFLSRRNLLGRIAQPLDIANAAVFLASDDAAFLTGQTLEVTGGS